MQNRIFITDSDCEKLRRLIDGRRAGNPADSAYLFMLEQELDRAEVVKAEKLPRDVVTMNSEVRLKDLSSGTIHRYRLVFPNQFRWDHSVSVLAPIGTAMLGYRVGDVIEWEVPRGIRLLKIIDVHYRAEPPEGGEDRTAAPSFAGSRSGG